MQVKSNIFRDLQESLKNIWIGIKQHKFRIAKTRPDPERYKSRRTKRVRSVKRRYSYKLAKINN